MNLTEMVSQEPPAADVSPLFSAAETALGAQIVNRSTVAALAFLLYDICLTFDGPKRNTA
ncbi:hypothetical protein L218DRAFT_1002238 [Marasmius fiardii PR-910]|nr:hypothetical protein L218DRAFT_1002238 [Marasmius fiardii PR-910]